MDALGLLRPIHSDTSRQLRAPLAYSKLRHDRFSSFSARCEPYRTMYLEYGQLQLDLISPLCIHADEW